MLNPSIGVNDAPTIDEIDAANTPSLVGYWKCDEGNGDTILDYSGNGYHLTMTDTYTIAGETNTASEAELTQGVLSRWSEHSGRFTPSFAQGAMIDLADAPLLDTTTNQLIFGCEVITHNKRGGIWSNVPSGVDFDIGTYYFGSDGSALYTNHYAPGQGFNIAAFAIGTGVYGARVDDGVNPEAAMLTSNAFIYNSVCPADIPITLVGGFNPSTAVMLAASDTNGDGGFNKNTTAVPATAPAQQLDSTTKYFGIRGQNSYPPRSGIKNVYVWSAASIAGDIENTVKWLANNPGRIPPWLIGK